MSKLYDLLYTIIGKLNSSVKTTAQTLTDAEKTQARANIGAQVTGDYAEKKDIPTVPTKVSAFTNDAGYLTQHQDLSAYAKKTEIPSKLPNPHALTINGKTYDGSSAVSVTVEGGGSGGGADWNAAEGEPGHVLHRTHWVDEAVELLSHTITGNTTMQVRDRIGLVAGDEYIVAVNGVENTYVAQAVSDDGFNFVVLETPEWRIMDYSPEAVAVSGYGASFNPYAFNGQLPVTITITTVGTVHKLDPKFLPDGVPHVEDGGFVEVLTETTTPLSGEDFTPIVIPSCPVSVGDTVSVKWNGTEYSCAAIDGSAFNMSGAVIVGNIGAMIGGANTGEPFIIALGEDEGVCAALIVAVDGSTEVALSIQKHVLTYHKIDEKLLPDNTVNNVVVVTGKYGEKASHTGGEILHAAMVDRKAVFFMFSRSTLPLKYVSDTTMTATFELIYASENEISRNYVVVEADGTISTVAQDETVFTFA